jgi:two-component system phosphoglycerate transport system response regulator PgtA
MNQPLPDAILSKTVLVIDDVQSAQKVVSRILTRLGFTNVLGAKSLAEAYQIIDETYLGLIITDIHLKDGAGFALIDALKQRERFVPILFITSDMDPESWETVQKLGQKMTYLLKPFSPETLAAKIQELF